MSELLYQLDLLKAINQKINKKDRMYRLVCDQMEGVFLYCSFEKNEVVTLGKWSELFSFEIEGMKDIDKLLDEVPETYYLSLREALFCEKGGRESAIAECPTKDKKTWLRFRVCVIYNEDRQPTEKIINILDITKQKQQNEELTYMAYYDNQTGLFNRNYFVRHLGEFVRRASEESCTVSVMIIDIDDFKKVDDGLGIAVGDELLQQFGGFLKELMSDDNMIAGHFNGDVFCIAIYDPSGERSVEHLHEKIQNRTKEPFCLSTGHVLRITVSAGVAEYPVASTKALELINCAEIVMFKGKNMGKNTIQYFDAPILKEFLNTIEIENKLKEAVFRNNFVLYYQPQYFASNRELRGMEALIRWKNENNEMISPATFIPIAEKNGAIIPIGNWVVERSIEQYAQWSRKYNTHFILSINISALQCNKDDFVDSILGMVEKYQVDASDIEIEITESILIDDFEAISSKLRVLREHGLRISLDDFGTGFSSLSYLKKLPIDTLKIDKSFIDTVLTDSPTRIITESIINMVKTLGFESIAEGVEEEQQFRYLNAIGCDTIQGFLLGKPQTVEEIDALLQRR